MHWHSTILQQGQRHTRLGQGGALSLNDQLCHIMTVILVTCGPCRVAGSDNSATALMTVAEAEEAEETKSDRTATAATSPTRPPLQPRSCSLKHMRSGLSEPGDMLDPLRRRRTGSQLLQLTADR